jgi:hypothetical protein
LAAAKRPSQLIDQLMSSSKTVEVVVVCSVSYTSKSSERSRSGMVASRARACFSVRTTSTCSGSP